MDLKALLFDLGIKVPDLVAGALGGAVYALTIQKAGPWSLASSIFVGAVTSNYCVEYGVKILGLGQGFAAFLIGLTAMVTTQVLVDLAKRWKPNLPGANGHAPKRPDGGSDERTG